MNKKCILIFAMWATAIVAVFSQNDFKAFNNLGVSLKLSPTLGYGVEAATGLNNMFILRLGLNMTYGISFGQRNIDLEFNESYIMERFGYEPEFRMKPLLKFTHGNLLVDFHPAGVFHITTGVFVGGLKFGVKGDLVDANNKKSVLLPGQSWPSYEIGDQTVAMNGGSAQADLRIGNIIKPYFGLGVGRAVAKNKRLAFKFELGALYQGNSYIVKSNGKKLDLSNSDDEDLRDIHDQITNEYAKYIRFWPQMNFQLSYRIF